MRTKDQILISNAPVFQFDFDDTLKAKCEQAMQEYADQCLSEYKANLKKSFKGYGAYNTDEVFIRIDTTEI